MALSSFIKKFEDKLVCIREEVSPILDAAEILMKYKKSIVLFENIYGYRAVGNLYSDEDRILKWANRDRRSFMRDFMKSIMNPTKCDEVSDAPFFSNEIKNVDLRKLPICKYFTSDGGRYITSSIVIAKIGNKINSSYHRLMLHDKKRMIIRMVEGRDLHRMYMQSKENGDELKVAVCIGNSPAVSLASAVTADYKTNEIEIGNSLQHRLTNEKIKVCTLDNDVIVPSDTDFVFEGRILHELKEEGPFVDITGTMDYIRRQPILEVDRIFYRDDALFHYVMPGGHEHYLLMGLPREPGILVALEEAGIDVRDVHLTAGGCRWFHGVISIKKKNKNDVRNAGMLALKAHRSMKHVIIVDDDIDVRDISQVEWAIATRFQADKDMILLSGEKGSSLDPSATDRITCKIVIDATVKSNNWNNNWDIFRRVWHP